MTPIDAVRPSDMQRYLEQRGWQRSEALSDREVHVYESPLRDDEGEPLRVFVPASTELPDFARMRDNLVSALGSLEGRPQEAIARGLLDAPRADVFSARVLPPEGSDRLDLREVVGLYHALFDLFAYAAAAELTKPSAYFGYQHREARRFAAGLLVPPPSPGSFIVQLESSVEGFTRPGGQKRAEAGGDEGMPLARRVMVRVMRGLRSAPALERGPEALEQLFQDGLNANMCEALTALHDAVQGAPVDFGVSWSSRIAVPADLRHVARIRYDQRSFEAVRQIGGALRQPSGPRPRTLIGHVVELRSRRASPASSGEREVSLSAEVDGRSLAVRISLEERDYLLACDAHRDRQPICVEGLLERIGKHWRLSRYEGFALAR